MSYHPTPCLRSVCTRSQSFPSTTRADDLRFQLKLLFALSQGHAGDTCNVEASISSQKFEHRLDDKREVLACPELGVSTVTEDSMTRRNNNTHFSLVASSLLKEAFTVSAASYSCSSSSCALLHSS